MIVVDLPYPTSVNRIWRSGQKRVFKSTEYTSWIKQAHLHWMEQRPKLRIRRIDGFYSIQIIVHPPDNRRRDIGNLEKVCSDWAQAAGIIEDDSLCRHQVIEYGNADQAPLGARLVFRPWPDTSSRLSTDS